MDLTANDINNWVAIYMATFMLAFACAWLAAVTVAIELLRERFWTQLATPRHWLLLAPRIWWRWQKRYLLGMPVILTIVAVFAATLEWSA